MSNNDKSTNDDTALEFGRQTALLKGQRSVVTNLEWNTSHSSWEPRMRKQSLVVIALPTLLVATIASAADFEEYAALSEQATIAHAALEGGSENVLPALRQNAVDRDVAAIDWLDALFASDEFETLDDDQQAQAIRDRFSLETNASQLLVELDRCEEARDRTQALLVSAFVDIELRPSVTEVYDEAVACLDRPVVAILTVDVVPDTAELYLNGELIGQASAAHDVPLGEHELIVQAEGYVARRTHFEAEEEGEEVELGPIVLAEVSDGSEPTWYEFTLWVGGAGVVAFSSVVFIMAIDRQNEIDSQSLPPNSAEQQDADRLFRVAYSGWAVGGAAIIAGTISYFVRKGNARDDEAVDVSMGPGILGGGPALFLQLNL